MSLLLKSHGELLYTTHGEKRTKEEKKGRKRREERKGDGRGRAEGKERRKDRKKKCFGGSSVESVTFLFDSIYAETKDT